MSELDGDLPANGAATRIVIVEDEGLLRDLLGQALARISGFQLVGSFGDAIGAGRDIPGLRADVAVLDIDLGDGNNGVSLGIELRASLPDIGIVLLSNHRDPAYLRAVPPDLAGGWSYLHKRAVNDVAALARAIRGAAEGMVVLDAWLAKQIMGGRLATDELSERSRAVLELVAQGFSNGTIAERLSFSEKTIEGQLTQIYRQLAIDTTNPAVHPRVQATLHYLRNR